MAGRAVVAVFRFLPWSLRYWLVRRSTPSFTLGVLVVLRRPDGAVLLVKTTYRQNWFLPGGTVKRDETLIDAARREVREEIGIDVTDINVDDRAWPDVRRRWVTWHAYANLTQGAADAARGCSAEIGELRWFAPSDIPRDADVVLRAVQLLSDR